MEFWTQEEQKEHRRLWVEALRSDKYQQTTEELRVGNGFCCLGVACEISGLGAWHDDKYITSDHRHRGELDPESDVTRWLGLASGNGAFGPRGPFGTQENLAHLNDNGSTFAEIAAVIESEPEGLFEQGAGA